MVNNIRFLLMPDKTSPNLGSAVLSRVAACLSGDWMERYGHPVLVAETFVDRKRCIHPIHALLGIMAAAYLADAPRGQKDLEVFAKSLSQGQLKALGVRRDTKTGRCSPPDQTTFSRMMSNVNADMVEEVLLEWQRRIRGPVPANETVAIDGKQPKHAGGHNVVTAIATPSQHYLGCEMVEDKSNEIPAARRLVARLDLDGKLVSPDAMHSCQQTARQLVVDEER